MAQTKFDSFISAADLAHLYLLPMALYYINAEGIQRKSIDFSCEIDIVSASCMAFLDYEAMKAAAQTTRICHSYLYIPLTGHRKHELPQELCAVCGWITGEKHDDLPCERMNRDGCICGVDWFFCIKCVQVYGDEILCLICIDDEPIYGLVYPQSSIVDAMNLSFNLSDAITKMGHYHPNKDPPDAYPYSVHEV